MDSVSAASVRYRIAIGPHSGSRTLTLHDPSLIRTDKPVKALTANLDGFSLNAAVVCQHYQRDRLERLCRYVTTHILFSPLDFLSKLAALVPRPRHNLVRYHGVFAPNAQIRKLIVPSATRKAKRKSERNEHKPAAESKAADELIAPMIWTQRLKRAFNLDITLCPICGGTLRVIADITDPDVIEKILGNIEAQPPPLISNTTRQT